MNALVLRSVTNLFFSGWFWAVILILTAVRIYGIIAYDGTGFPDRFFYLHYSDLILTETWWLHEIAQEPLPVTAFRAIGYPLVIAAAKLIAGEGFVSLIQSVQAFVSLAACAILFAALSRLTASNMKAGLAVLGYGLSVGLSYELSLLTDSLFLSCWIILVSVCLLHWLEKQPFSLFDALTIGLLALVMTSFRGNGIHMVLLAVPLVALAVFNRQASILRLGFVGILILLPSLAAYAGIAEWNRYRTGERFFTTGAQIALNQPVFAMARLGADPFQGDDPLRTAIREIAPELTYEQIYQVNTHLYSSEGMTPHQIASANTALYLDTVFENPGVFGRMWLRNFDEKFATGLINPAFGLNQAHLLATGDRAFPGFSSIVKGDSPGFTNIAYAAVYGVGIVLSVVVFAAAILLAPVRLIFRFLSGNPDRFTVGISALWIVSILVHAYYGALWVELRYVIMTAPLLAAIGLWAIRPGRTTPSFR